MIIKGNFPIVPSMFELRGIKPLLLPDFIHGKELKFSSLIYFCVEKIILQIISEFLRHSLEQINQTSISIFIIARFIGVEGTNSALVYIKTIRRGSNMEILPLQTSSMNIKQISSQPFSNWAWVKS